MQKNIESSVKETIAKLEKEVETITNPIKKKNIQKEIDDLKKRFQKDESIYHV